MDPDTTSLERAFDLARSGHCPNVAEIKKRLRKEGYSAEQIMGPRLEAQLRALIEAANARPGG